MSTLIQVVIAIVIAGVVGVVLGLLAWRRMRTVQLREEFGPEYDRAVERHGSRAKAERELLDRRRRHRELDIRPLDAESRERHREQWAHIQEQFVDSPEGALDEADRLVSAVVAERGYPTDDFDDRIATLSVGHGRTVEDYRRAHEISARSAGKEASTEDLRQAMVHYRALFEDLLEPAAEERTRHTGVKQPDSGSTRPEE